MSSPPPPPCDQHSRNWLDLPSDLMLTILSKLGAVEVLLRAQLVCSKWRKISMDPSLWTSIKMHYVGYPYYLDSHLEAMCFHAVNRSRGGLLAIDLNGFGSNPLLEHISDRACGLRCLRLACTYGISHWAMIEAVAKLPLLEELELSCFSFPKEVIEAVGRSCRLLKSFKSNYVGIHRAHLEYDENAQVIAGNLHELRHLQLVGDNMTDNGVHAILDGCPHLESLDLRQCEHVNLGGDLEQRCAERIKELKRPKDPISDSEFKDLRNDYHLDDKIEDDVSHDPTDDGVIYEVEYPSGPSDIDSLSDDNGHCEFWHYEFSDGTDEDDSDNVSDSGSEDMHLD